MADEFGAGLSTGVVAGIIGGVAAGVVLVLVGLLMPRPKCEGCGADLPRVRAPKNVRQALAGGWTCPKCGCECDRRGRRVR